MSVKKLELPAYDPRGVQGHGLQYATSNRGGCHVRGYLISPEVLGVPEKVDRFALEGKPALARLFQDLTAVIDSLGLCLFTSFALCADDYRDLYNTIAGGDWTTADMLAAGDRIWNMERLFNLAAGIDPSEGKLPERLSTSPFPPGRPRARAPTGGTPAGVLPKDAVGTRRHPDTGETRGPGAELRRIMQVEVRLFATCGRIDSARTLDFAEEHGRRSPPPPEHPPQRSRHPSGEWAGRHRRSSARRRRGLAVPAHRRRVKLQW